MSIDPNNLQATAKLTWSDEFNGLSLWNGSSGTWSSNWWHKDEWGLYSSSNGSTLAGNGEQQWYINANYAQTSAVTPWSVSDGVLTITAAPADAAIKPLINNYDYTSGMLNTWHSFSQEYGYFEISAKLPAGQGLWPAFWLLPEDGSWPPELDVFEVIGKEPNTLHTAVHTAETGQHTSQGGQTQTGADLAAGFNRYGVNWQPDTVTFYFNGQQVSQFATPDDMHKPMYLITNLAVGGYWPGSPDGSTHFPAQLQVDYIRAYADAPDVAAPPPAAEPAPGAPANAPPPPVPQAAAAAPSSDEPVISISGSPALPEGQSGLTNFAFTVSKSGDASQASIVDYFLWSDKWGEVDASDTSGPTAGSVYFDPGERQKIIEIAVVGDNRPEADEVFHVNLSNFRGAAAGVDMATGTILNDDGWVV